MELSVVYAWFCENVAGFNSKHVINSHIIPSRGIIE